MTIIAIISLFSVLFTSSLSANPPSAPVNPETACNNTLYPPFCKSILPPQTSQNLSTFTLISVSKSLTTSQSHLNLISKFLQIIRPALSQNAIFAVEDCLFLSELNIDLLFTTNFSLNSSTGSLSIPETANVHTLLSSTLTNLQTCLDGLYILNQSVIMNRLYNPLSNGTMLYSVALDLFAHTWVSKSKPVSSRRLLFGKDYQNAQSISMSRFNREPNGRRLWQAPSGVLIRATVVVSSDGSGNFTTIGDAVSSAPNKSDGSSGYYLIYVTAGIYEEYVSIPKNKNYVMMVGDGINQTLVTGNRSVVDGWTTFNSATFAVVAHNFVAINMTFRNTAGAIKHQAVALRNGADLSTFYRCSFEGYQDTLYSHSMRQFYRDCDIYGTVDFIFGNAAVVLQNCNIYAQLPMHGQSDLITAQGRTDPNQNTGISVHNCNIKAGNDLAADNGTTKTYLGRPWKEYSRTVYIQSFMDSLVDPAGWLAWSGDFALSTLYYAEYDNTGLGSNTTNRVTWPGYRIINSTEASDFTVGNFLLGDFWLPETGVPYSSDLL